MQYTGIPHFIVLHRYCIFYKLIDPGQRSDPIKFVFYKTHIGVPKLGVGGTIIFGPDLRPEEEEIPMIHTL